MVHPTEEAKPSRSDGFACYGCRYPRPGGPPRGDHLAVAVVGWRVAGYGPVLRRRARCDRGAVLLSGTLAVPVQSVTVPSPHPPPPLLGPRLGSPRRHRLGRLDGRIGCRRAKRHDAAYDCCVARPATPTSLLQSPTHSCVCVRVVVFYPGKIFFYSVLHPPATANRTVETGVRPRPPHVLKQSGARFVCSRSTCTCDTGAWLERVVGTGCIWSMHFQCNLGVGAHPASMGQDRPMPGRHSSNSNPTQSS